MPRKVNFKRFLADLDAAASTVDTLHQDVIHTTERFWNFRAVLEAELNQRLSDEAILQILGVLIAIAAGPSFPKNGSKAAWWRDILIVMLRVILSENGVSVSLSYTDLAQTKIDRPFARCLYASWSMLPNKCRGKSAEALIARARSWRSTSVVTKFDCAPFRYAAESGLELLEIVRRSQLNSISAADAIRKLRSKVASGSTKYQKPTNPTLPSQ